MVSHGSQDQRVGWPAVEQTGGKNGRNKHSITTPCQASNPTPSPAAPSGFVQPCAAANGGGALLFQSTRLVAAVVELGSVRPLNISVSTPSVVKAFYERIWNAGDLAAIPELLAEGFAFRGSLGSEMCGRKAFEDYVRSVRGSLSNYRCEILDCVTEGDRAFAKMRFSGLHTGAFRGYQPTSKPVHWLGAALFRIERGTISELWVLGDLAGLDDVLQHNHVA